MKEIYVLKTSRIKNKPGTWDSVLCQVFKNDILIGEYIRHYPSFVETTFFPFTAADGNDYALYSGDYELISIMRLDDGKDIQTKESKDQMHGFCPTEIFIPENKLIAFAQGCVWGDDSSWKLNILDLRDAHNGNLWYIDKHFERNWLYEEFPPYSELKHIMMDEEAIFPEWLSYPTVVWLPKNKE